MYIDTKIFSISLQCRKYFVAHSILCGATTTALLWMKDTKQRPFREEKWVEWKINLTASMTKPLNGVPRVREVWRSNPRSAKSYTALQRVRYRLRK